MKAEQVRPAARLLVVAVSGIVCGIAHAQHNPTTQGDDSAVPEVVVTAQRTAALASRTPVAMSVVSGEQLRDLGANSPATIGSRLPNVHLLFGDGMLGYAKGAPYAAIIAAAGGEALPQAWIDQLAVGGRLVAPLKVANGAQALVVIDKTAQGIRQSVLEAVHFVPLKSGTS